MSESPEAGLNKIHVADHFAGILQRDRPVTVLFCGKVSHPLAAGCIGRIPWPLESHDFRPGDVLPANPSSRQMEGSHQEPFRFQDSHAFMTSATMAIQSPPSA